MDPQYSESLCPLSNTLTSLGCHSPGDNGILNTVDPITLVSNYYYFRYFITVVLHSRLLWPIIPKFMLAY